MVYYNENDPEKAAWIRELIRRNIVAPGDVDERSIADVKPDDLKGYKQCHFFAGIAVWSYALRLAGWPDDRECWTGSCPCPSFSAAGKGEGFDDPRHLWPAWWPLIRERRPPTLFGEQVAAAIRHGWWDLVSTDLESEGYAAAAAVLTSAGVGAPDIRERLYWVADSNQRRPEQRYSGERAVQFASAECATDWMAHSERDGRWPDIAQRGPEGRDADGRPGEALRLADTSPRGRGMLRSASRSAGHVESGDEASRMANADSNGHDGAQRTETIANRDEPQHGLFERDGAASGMENPDGLFSQQYAGSGPGPGEAEGSRTHGESAGRSKACGMADADGGEPGIGELQRSGEYGLVTEDGRVLVKHFAPDALKGFWGTADWLFCTDGRWRPVEAGTFPLDHGAAFRLGRLRGYGDAINAYTAKAFIEAAMSKQHVSGRDPVDTISGDAS